MPWWWKKKEKDAELAVQPPAVNNVAKATFKVSLVVTDAEESNVKALGEELREALMKKGSETSSFYLTQGIYYFASNGGEPLQIKVPYSWLVVTDDAIISYMPGSRTAYSSDVFITIIARDFQTLRSYTEKMINTLSKQFLNFKVVGISIGNVSA
jgi:hypothetical protein